MGLAAPAGRGRPGRQRLHAGCATSSRRVGWGVRGHVAQWRPQTRGLFGCGGIELRPFPTHTCFRRLRDQGQQRSGDHPETAAGSTLGPDLRERPRPQPRAPRHRSHWAGGRSGAEVAGPRDRLGELADPCRFVQPVATTLRIVNGSGATRSWGRRPHPPTCATMSPVRRVDDERPRLGDPPRTATGREADGIESTVRSQPGTGTTDCGATIEGMKPAEAQRDRQGRLRPSWPAPSRWLGRPVGADRPKACRARPACEVSTSDPESASPETAAPRDSADRHPGVRNCASIAGRRRPRSASGASRSCRRPRPER